MRGWALGMEWEAVSANSCTSSSQAGELHREESQDQFSRQFHTFPTGSRTPVLIISGRKEHTPRSEKPRAGKKLSF